MESKKINQLATELTPALSDLTIIGDPTTGISKKITLSQMASLFTGTVEEYANLAAFPLVGVADTIYIALDTNVLYRWDTGLTSYVELSPNIINSLVFSDANGFDGNISLIGSTATLTITTALTTGSVPFIGASGALSQDNANYFWDNTNKRLGINTNAPTTAFDVFGSGIIGRLNGTSTNNSFLGFASGGTNQWSIGNVQSDQRFRIYSEANTAELVSVLQTGEFGIGIANPTTKLHIDGGASALIANLDANVSVAKSISFRSDNSNRINLEVSGTESGSNAGANFFLRTYTDAGALLATPLTITRSTGAISLATALSGTSASFSSTISATGATFTDNVLINNSASLSKISIKGSGSTTGLDLYVFGLNATLSNQDNGSLAFQTNGTDRLTIASTGSVGIGTIPPTTTNFANFFVGRNISMFSGSSTDIYIGSNFYYDGGFKVRYSEASAMINTNAGSIIFQNSSSGTAGGTFNGVERMRINSGGGVQIFGNDGVLYTKATTVGKAIYWDIRNSADSRRGYIGFGGDGSSDFQFSNNENGSQAFITNGTERMRITSGGVVGIGGNAGAGRLQAWGENQSSANYALGIYNSGGFGLFFVRNDGAHFLSAFTYNNTVSGGTRTVYIDNSYALGGISSIRASKKNIQEFSSQWIYDLKPVQFNYRKKDKNGNYTEEIYEEITYGLIAEDTEPIADFLINYNDNKDGSKEMVGIEYMRLITPMLKEIQELKKQIEILKLK